MMTSETTSPDQTTEPRALRGGHESWLVAAFLALFSVAVAAAMPQISVAVRTAIDGNKPSLGHADAKDRAGVRVRGISVRALTPKAFGGSVAVIPPTSSAVALPLSPLATATHADLAALIRSRGIAARAPPAGTA